MVSTAEIAEWPSNPFPQPLALGLFEYPLLPGESAGSCLLAHRAVSAACPEQDKEELG